MKNRVCFCPASLKWIFNHLQKSAKSKFRKMVQGQVVPALVNLRKRKRIHIGGRRQKGKRRTAKQQAATRKLVAFNRRRRR